MDSNVGIQSGWRTCRFRRSMFVFGHLDRRYGCYGLSAIMFDANLARGCAVRGEQGEEPVLLQWVSEGPSRSGSDKSACSNPDEGNEDECGRLASSSHAGSLGELTESSKRATVRRRIVDSKSGVGDGSSLDAVCLAQDF